ncbi:hypothetical protein Mgra_00005899 [Meloidogyne graminicola]|uniref:EGF-like domain-containing protein n=1 Tax=Meloidogyne graminicola TaxID=189291 RepID=A0A8S9ZMX2_9BILA|nr:hypothetical protein Mgra_00005899 [Meloidogyne graminicola]
MNCKIIIKISLKLCLSSCRRLPSCQNNGFRSLLDPKQCFCLEPFFGERCERICDRGRRLRGMDGRDYCNCLPFYHGIECREPICLNGGRSLFDARGCECLPPFIGFHCEFDGNRTQRFEFEANVGNVGEMFSTRDISGTVFSIVMIIVLVLSMYMLMKHRMVQTRHMNRRTDLLGAEESVMATGLGRYSLPPLMRRLTPFFTSGDNPPPYALNQRESAQRSRNLPPLPSYEDATKLPAIRTELRDENTHLGVQEHQELCSSELTNESRIQINHQSQTEENNVEPINEGNIECELSELLDVNKKTTEEPIK